jgi:glycosyltransferase involved in cell wall biosynthesis
MSDEFYTYFRLKIPQVLARGAAHLMDRFIPRKADFTIAINRRVANFLIEYGVSADKIKYIPPGIDFNYQELSPNPRLRQELNLGEGPLILYSGNLDDYQRMDLLLAALPEIFLQQPEARLILLTGSDSSSFMQKARALGVESHISNIPHSCFSKVREIMALGSVAVNPRISWSGFPIKLLNYMASGLPVVAFSGAAAPILDGVNGLLVPPEDVTAFAGAITALTRQPALARQLGECGRRLVQQHYSWAVIASDIERIYDKVIAETK